LWEKMAGIKDWQIWVGGYDEIGGKGPLAFHESERLEVKRLLPEKERTQRFPASVKAG